MSKPPKKPRKPHVRYSEALVDGICARLAGGESLNRICKTPDMPDIGVFIGWAVDNRDGLSQKYARAREIQAELYAQKIEAVAQTLPEFATSTRADGTVEKRRDPAFVAWQKNQIDALKWIACKLRPRVYGDKLAVEGDITLNIADRLEAARKRLNAVGPHDVNAVGPHDVNVVGPHDVNVVGPHDLNVVGPHDLNDATE